MRPIIVWLILCTACVTAVEVEPIQKRDTPIVITHGEGETVNAVFVTPGGAWEFLADNHFRRGDTETIMAGPPGQYLVTTGDSSIINVIEEGRPDPDPQPRPDPTPDPQPEPDPQPDPPDPEPGPAPILAKWLVFLEEQSERANNPQQTAVITSLALRESLIDRGIKVRVYDDDQPAAQPFAKVAGTDRPAMILIEDSKNFRVFDVPDSVAAVEQIVMENTLR